MISTTNENPRDDGASERRRRPVGVWILAIAHVVYAALGIYGWSRGLTASIPHGWSPAMVAQAPYIVVLFVGLLLSACGAWLGNRHARLLLLVLLTVVMGFSLREVLLGYLIVAEETERWRSALSWSVTTAIALLLWLGVNYWYFFGRRTQDFYSATSSRSTNA